VTPLTQPHQTGTLAKPGLAEEFIIAIEGGGRANTDLSDNWDFWPLMPLPLDEAREARHNRVELAIRSTASTA
jgi:hypothetical protein